MPELSIPPLFPEPSLKERSGLMTIAWISIAIVLAVATVWLLLFVALRYSPSATISAKQDDPTTAHRVFGDYRPRPIQRDWPAFNKLFTSSAADLQQKIEQAARDQEGISIGVSVRAITDTEHIAYQEDKVFTAASTTKIITAAAVLSMVDNQTVTLSQKLGDSTVEQQLQLMVNQSNNTAWENLNNLVGLQNLQDYATQLDLYSFRVLGNKINAHDLGVFLQLLYRNELLSTESTKLLLSWMQKTNQPDMLPAVFQASDQVYHKYGWIAQNIHDAAIIVHHDQPFILVILTDGTLNYNQGRQLVKSLASIIQSDLR